MPVAQLVLRQREAHGADRRVVDERGLAEVVPGAVGACGGIERGALAAVHGVESRAQEEVGHQVEGRHHTAADEPRGVEVGHVDHLRMLHRGVGGHRHERGLGRMEVGMVRIDAVDVEAEGEPAARGDVEILVPGEASAGPAAAQAGEESVGVIGTVAVAAPDPDGREAQVGTVPRVEELVERIAGHLGLHAHEEEAREVRILGKGVVRIVAVIDMPEVRAERQHAAVREGHARPHGEEALALLDLVGVVDAREVAEGAVAEVVHREVVGVVEEKGIHEVEIRTTSDGSPGVDGPEVELRHELLPDAAHPLAVDADVGLVEGRRGDVSAEGDLEVGTRVEAGAEGVSPLDGVVAHMGELHGEFAAGEHLEEVVAQFVEAHRALPPGGAAVHLHEVADVGTLLAVEAFEAIVVENQRRAVAAEGGAACGVVDRALPAADSAEDLRHGGHGILITLVHDRLGAVEIEHAGLHGPADRHAAPLGKVVVRILHGEHEGLVHDAALLGGRGVSRRADRPHEEVGAEGFVEGLPGEVVVDASVVEKHRVQLHGLECQRYGHRRADRLAQLAAAQHHGPAVVHVARHAEEGDHQAVEVAVAGRRGRGEELGEGQVDLRRGDEVRGDLDAFSGDLRDVDAQAQERGVAADLAVVVEVFVGVDASRYPLPDHARADDLAHLRGGVSRGVHGCDDRPHGGSGDVVDGHAARLEGFEHADMVEPLRAAAAHHDTHRLPFGRRHPAPQQQDKSEHFTHHIQFFCNFAR